MYIVYRNGEVIMVTDSLVDVFKTATFNDSFKEVKKMKYVVKLSHYDAKDGYSNTETYETGECEELFTARDWASELETDNESGWIEVKVEFYADDADPMFDDPITVDVYNKTITGKF